MEIIISPMQATAEKNLTGPRLRFRVTRSHLATSRGWGVVLPCPDGETAAYWEWSLGGGAETSVG